MGPMTLAMLAALLIGTGVGVQTGTQPARNKEKRETAIQEIQNKYGVDSATAEYLYEQYGGTDFNLFDSSTWGKDHDMDWEALDRDYQDYLTWKDKVGDMPTLPDIDVLNTQADSTIEAENAQINDLYDQMFNRSTDMLNQSLAENNAAFADYRNQLLTNEAMGQQAIAGSTRYELDRQQRNAISRGASAAQRLVSNINAQLGLQAQSAQQALNTSNALAQQLLAHREAQLGLRNDYMNAMNTRDTNRANLIQGSAERRLGYRTGLKGEAMNDYYSKRDAWEDSASAYGGDNPFVDYHRRQALKNTL